MTPPDLYTALQKYGQHAFGCATRGTAQHPLGAFAVVNAGPCDCGLAVILAASPPSPAPSGLVEEMADWIVFDFAVKTPGLNANEKLFFRDHIATALTAAQASSLRAVWEEAFAVVCGICNTPGPTWRLEKDEDGGWIHVWAGEQATTVPPQYPCRAAALRARRDREGAR